MNHFHVAAGILRDPAGMVLITERRCDGPYNGLWEFPGGKIRNGESPSDALWRELREELGIDAVSVEPFMRLSHSYLDRSVELEFFLVAEWRGEPSGLEGQRIRWVPITELDIDELLPADGPLVAALQKR
jgi:8-oxo-dGTP diphosphatase